MGRTTIGLLAAAAAVFAASCAKGGDPVPVPTPIAPPTVTENFSGTLAVGGSNLHFFQVLQNSEVDVTLTSMIAVAVDADPTVDPPVVAQPATPVTAPMTIVVGQQALTTIGVQCAPLKLVDAPAGAQPQIKGQALQGTYCVSVTDTNSQLPRAATYAISVAHAAAP